MSAEPRPEFSRPLALGLVGEAGREERLEATSAECAALAARFGILGIGRFGAVLKLRPEPDGPVLAEGRIRAEVTQACVVTLEPVVQEIDAPVAFRFLPAGVEPDDEPDEVDEIETHHGVADLGEAVAEALALALDPYPRAPDAELPPEASDGTAHPFGVLTGLRRGEKH